MLRRWIAAGLLLAQAGVSLAAGVGALAGRAKTQCCNERMCPRPASAPKAATSSHCHESAPSSDAKMKCNCQNGDAQISLVVSSRPYVVEAASAGTPAPAYAGLALATAERTRTGFGRLDSPPPRAL